MCHSLLEGLLHILIYIYATVSKFSVHVVTVGTCCDCLLRCYIGMVEYADMIMMYSSSKIITCAVRYVNNPTQF
jgi:hypothetical protein